MNIVEGRQVATPSHRRSMSIMTSASSSAPVSAVSFVESQDTSYGIQLPFDMMVPPDQDILSQVYTTNENGFGPFQDWLQAQQGHAHPAILDAVDSGTESIDATSVLSNAALPSLELEERISHVLRAAEEMGFESFDIVVTEYYTAKFSEGSLPFYAQSTSRSRRLRQFLTDLHESSKTWTGREAQGYHEERVIAMERSYEEEFERLARKGLCGSDSEIKKRAFVASIVTQLLQDETTNRLWRRDKQYLREQVCVVPFLPSYEAEILCTAPRNLVVTVNFGAKGRTSRRRSVASNMHFPLHAADSEVMRELGR